jgi:hypothetical protein
VDLSKSTIEVIKAKVCRECLQLKAKCLQVKAKVCGECLQLVHEVQHESDLRATEHGTRWHEVQHESDRASLRPAPLSKKDQEGLRGLRRPRGLESQKDKEGLRGLRRPCFALGVAAL